MEHLFQKSKCSISHYIFKYIFQRCQKALLWSKGLKNDFIHQNRNIAGPINSTYRAALTGSR